MTDDPKVEILDLLGMLIASGKGFQVALCPPGENGKSDWQAIARHADKWARTQMGVPGVPHDRPWVALRSALRALVDHDPSAAAKVWRKKHGVPEPTKRVQPVETKAFDDLNDLLGGEPVKTNPLDDLL